MSIHSKAFTVYKSYKLYKLYGFFFLECMYFGEKLASQITFECLFLQMKGKVPYILQNNGDLMINAEFLFNLIPHMMFRDKFVIVDYL